MKIKLKMKKYPNRDVSSPVKGGAMLLDEGLNKINEFPEVARKPISAIEDDHGKIAYELPEFILVAENEPYGRIVSIAGNLIRYASKSNKNFIMYLKKSGKFYVIPLRTIPDKLINHRGKVEMWNFEIGLLIPLNTYLNPPKLKPAVAKMSLF